MGQAIKRTAPPTVSGSYDRGLLVTGLLLVAFGVVMVASASMPLADRNFSSEFYYLWRHLLSLGLALVIAWGVYALSLDLWQRIGPLLFMGGLLLLVLLMIPGLGHTVNGATRWLRIGWFNLQPAEWMKLFTIVYLAGYLVRRRQQVMQSFWGFFKPMLLLSAAGVLILSQPDFGSLAVLLAVAMGMMFLAGVPIGQFVLLVATALVAMVALVIVEPYRMQRITAFTDPWSDPFNTGFQLTQALIAMGRGEWWGVGLGNGVQKQFYLPEAHTDFILAVIGEEFGLLGTLLVTLAFGYLVWRAFQVGMHADARKELAGAYMAYGVGLLFAIQAAVSIGVNLGMLPTKGLTLPFLSYGSNSLMVSVTGLALLLRIDRENRGEQLAAVPDEGARTAAGRDGE